MAKVIREFGVATCVWVEPAKWEDPEWDPWRKGYMFETGWLNLCESEKKYPGLQFLYFWGGEESEKDWYLKTFYGHLEQEGNKLTFTTVNSCYVFQLLQE